MSGDFVTRYWKGRSGISPRFGMVYPGRRLLMDKATAEKFSADLQKDPVKKREPVEEQPEEQQKKKSRTKR